MFGMPIFFKFPLRKLNENYLSSVCAALVFPRFAARFLFDHSGYLAGSFFVNRMHE
jgi:hypothetical protein